MGNISMSIDKCVADRYQKEARERSLDRSTRGRAVMTSVHPAAVRRRRLVRVLVAVGSAVAIGGGWTAAAYQASASVPPNPSGWNLMFKDDFDGPAGSSPSGNCQQTTGTS